MLPKQPHETRKNYSALSKERKNVFDEFKELVETLIPISETEMPESTAAIVRIRPETVHESAMVGIATAIEAMLGGVQNRTDRVAEMSANANGILDPLVVKIDRQQAEIDAAYEGIVAGNALGLGLVDNVDRKTDIIDRMLDGDRAEDEADDVAQAKAAVDAAFQRLPEYESLASEPVETTTPQPTAQQPSVATENPEADAIRAKLAEIHREIEGSSDEQFALAA